MNAGQLNERVSVLSLWSDANAYEWREIGAVWMRAEPQERSNLFSKFGLGAPSVRFTMRRQAFTLHQALQWQGRHYLPTDIRDIDRMYYEVTAAQVNLMQCVAFETDEQVSASKQVAHKLGKSVSFPVAVTEKFLRATDYEPMVQDECTYVLVAPKPIILEPNRVVQVDTLKYRVQLCHLLDSYKNEYEIIRRREA